MTSLLAFLGTAQATFTFATDSVYNYFGTQMHANLRLKCLAKPGPGVPFFAKPSDCGWKDHFELPRVSAIWLLSAH